LQAGPNIFGLQCRIIMENLLARPSSRKSPRAGRTSRGATFRKTIVAAALAEESQTGRNRIAAPPASWPPRRHRSRPAHAESQTRFTQARPDSVVTCGSFRLAPVYGLLDGEGGSTAAPFPLDPSLATHLLSERILSSAAFSLRSSGSPRIGIKLYFQAHFALESILSFRLITDWKMLRYSATATAVR